MTTAHPETALSRLARDFQGTEAQVIMTACVREIISLRDQLIYARRDQRVLQILLANTHLQSTREYQSALALVSEGNHR